MAVYESFCQWAWLLEVSSLFIITIFVYYHQSEYNARRDFLWRQIAIRDQESMAKLRNCNRFIFYNLLPPHVASYFLKERHPNVSHMDLYHESYDRIGVVFATISNFGDFYEEVNTNNHGLECLRLLNEIICDFDMILDDDRFKAVDKIKTIGTTYMAAIGLYPDSKLPSGPIDWRSSLNVDPDASSSKTMLSSSSSSSFDIAIIDADDSGLQMAIDPTTNSISGFPAVGSIQQQQQQHQQQTTLSETDVAYNGVSEAQEGNEIIALKSRTSSGKRDSWENRRLVARYLQTLVRFVIEMKVRLNDININSFNKFNLKAGINLGPVTAGVIGASKPQYDIWGNTVNVASRMESTAEPNRIQITEEVYNILKDFNQEEKFTFSCRGKIDVKGKGFMTTYYLDYN